MQGRGQEDQLEIMRDFMRRSGVDVPKESHHSLTDSAIGRLRYTPFTLTFYRLCPPF